jgi:hypothetical protein
LIIYSRTESKISAANTQIRIITLCESIFVGIAHKL